MWLVTIIGIIVVLLLLIASTAFRCLSSNTLASVIEIGSIVIFIVLFGILMLYFLSDSDDGHEILDEYTRKARAKQKSQYLNIIAAINEQRNASKILLALSTTSSPPSG